MDKGDWILLGGFSILFGSLLLLAYLKSPKDDSHLHKPCISCEIENMRSLIYQIKPLPENMMLIYEMHHCLDSMEMANNE